MEETLAFRDYLIAELQSRGFPIVRVNGCNITFRSSYGMVGFYFDRLEQRWYCNSNEFTLFLKERIKRFHLEKC